MARILSIEDDAEVQHLIGQALFREGYEVHYAWNGREGYEKILALRPDLILLDLMLPVMNGVELLKELRESKATRSIPVIIVSGYGDEAHLLGDSVKALGAVEYLRKPVQIHELTALVRKTLALFHQPAGGASERETRKLRKGAVRADPKFRTVWIDDRLVSTIPHKRFTLLRRLLESPGPVARGELLRSLGYGPDQLNTLEKTLQRLREDLGAGGRRIQTTPDGYELVG